MNTKPNPSAPRLPRRGRRPVVGRLINFPLPLFRRIVAAGIKKGELTPFVVRAVERALDAMEQKELTQ